MDTEETPPLEKKESPPAPQKESTESTPKVEAKEQLPKEPPIELPPFISVNALHQKSIAELYEQGYSYGLRVGGGRGKFELVNDLVVYYLSHGTCVEAEGILEISRDGRGYLRWEINNFAQTPDNPTIPQALLKQHSLLNAQRIKVQYRPLRRPFKERYFVTESILEIEGTPVEDWKTLTDFDKHTPLFPSERIILENEKAPSISARIVDLVAPLGKGQRGLIVAPPRGGKTILLKEIASAITANHSEIELFVLLLDERPEEVTDFIENVDAQVFSSTFDEAPTRHVQVAELVSERAKRRVEMGKDVVILLDSITRLARGYNALQSGKGRIMSGGMDAKALAKPKRFFGAARNIENGGSLTILATALVETESRMDDVIFEEFKGTGNMEAHLDRELAEQRLFPAIHLSKSGTRKDDLLYHPEEMKKINVLRRQLASLPYGEAMETLIKALQKYKSNAELLLSGLR